MKKFYPTIMKGVAGIGMVLASALSVSAAPNEVNRMDAADIKASDCKSRSQAPGYAAIRGHNRDLPYCKLNYQNEVLKIEWFDIYANCCPEGFSSRIEFQENSDYLSIYVQPNDDRCNCLCHFDVTTEFTGIKPGKYTMLLYPDSDPMYCEVELEEGFEKVIGKPAPTPEDGRITPSYSSTSDCYHGVASVAPGVSPLRSSEDGGWQISYSYNELSLTWEDLKTNCASLGFNTWFIPGEDPHVLDFYVDEIFIEGYDIMADCMCFFKAYSTFPDIEEGEYTLRFHEFGQVYETTVNLSNGLDEHFSRKLLTGASQIEYQDSALHVIGGNLLSVRSEGAFSLEIVGTNGMTPIRVNGEDATEIGLDNLPGGIYIVRLKAADGSTHVTRFNR